MSDGYDPGTVWCEKHGAALVLLARQWVEAALCRLPENQAEVLVMRIWGGLIFRQVAAALNTSENTAASRYRYSLTKLREQLAEELML